MTGTTTKKDTVRVALETLIRLGRQSELRGLRGALRWKGDLDEMRRELP